MMVKMMGPTESASTKPRTKPFTIASIIMIMSVSMRGRIWYFPTQFTNIHEQYTGGEGFNKKELLNLGNFFQICFPILKHLTFQYPGEFVLAPFFALQS